MSNRQAARKLARKQFGKHPDFRARYAEGSRSLGDFIESIILYNLENNEKEASFWRAEMKTFFPDFTETV